MKTITLDEQLKILSPYIVIEHIPFFRPNYNPNDIQTRQCKECGLFFVPDFRGDKYREMHLAICVDCLQSLLNSNDLKG